MQTATHLIDCYIAIWSETDAERRRELVTEVWTETGSYLDPVLEAKGHTAIDAMVQRAQERFPGHRFRRTSDVDAHHGRVPLLL